MSLALLETWLSGLEPLPMRDDASVAELRQHVRAAGAARGVDRMLVERAALVASELGTNQIRHARRGEIAVEVFARGDLLGVELVAADLGAGLAEPAAALAGDGPKPTGSLGVGLAAVREQASELDIDVRLGEGTCVRARVLPGAAPRRREVGIIGRAHPNERVSGDHATFYRTSSDLILTVIDGLGHGEEARAAADAAIAEALRRRDRSPADVVSDCDDALRGTRGVVMTVVSVDEEIGEIGHAGVGNIVTRIEQPVGSVPDTTGRHSRSFSGPSFVVGGSTRSAQLSAGIRPRRRFQIERAPIGHRDVLLMVTDGLGSRLSLGDQPALYREHPIVIAQTLLARFSRAHDDALVAVAR